MISIACQAKLKDGRQIWIPPNGGLPFWTHCQPTEYLTMEEIRQWIPWWLARVKG